MINRCCLGLDVLVGYPLNAPVDETRRKVKEKSIEKQKRGPGGGENLYGTTQFAQVLPLHSLGALDALEAIDAPHARYATDAIAPCYNIRQRTVQGAIHWRSFLRQNTS